MEDIWSCSNVIGLNLWLEKKQRGSGAELRTTLEYGTGNDRTNTIAPSPLLHFSFRTILKSDQNGGGIILIELSRCEIERGQKLTNLSS